MGARDMAGQVDYFEIGTPDSDGAKKFYGGLFGWPMSEPNPQTGYRAIDETKGGVWDTSSMGGAHWAIFYVHVDDVKAAAAQAEELGGKVLVPYTDGGDIEFAHLEDPFGNRFGVWRRKA
jgi:predicted enzyme related to lactoylglutathione lyase